MPAKFFGPALCVCCLALFQIAVIEAADTKPTKSNAPSHATAEQSQAKPAELIALNWQDDYSQAMQQAKDEKKMMLVHFFRPSDQKRSNAAEAGDSVSTIEKTLASADLQKQTDRFV